MIIDVAVAEVVPLVALVLPTILLLLFAEVTPIPAGLQVTGGGALVLDIVGDDVTAAAGDLVVAFIVKLN